MQNTPSSPASLSIKSEPTVNRITRVQNLSRETFPQSSLLVCWCSLIQRNQPPKPSSPIERATLYLEILSSHWASYKETSYCCCQCNSSKTETWTLKLKTGKHQTFSKKFNKTSETLRVTFFRILMGLEGSDGAQSNWMDYTHTFFSREHCSSTFQRYSMLIYFVRSNFRGSAIWI